MTIDDIGKLVYSSVLDNKSQVVVVSNMTAISLLSEAKKEIHNASETEDNEFRLYGVPIKILDIGPLQFEGALLMSQEQYKKLTSATRLYKQHEINDANL